MLSNYRPYLILAIISAASAGFLFGINTGNIAGALPFIHLQFKTTTLQNEGIVSSTILFAFLSALCSANVAKKYGHRTLLLFTGLCFVAGSFLAGHAMSIVALLIARALLGTAIGISSYAAPLYIAEIAPAPVRGFFVLLNGVAITGGEAIAFYLDYAYGDQGQWRLMLMWSGYPALIFLLSTFLMPDAPRWLLAKGQRLAAIRVLKTFHPTHTIASLMNDMQQIHSHPFLSLNQLFSQKKYRTPLIIGISLGVFQQFFGINTIMYYGPYVFEKAGFSLMSMAIWVTFIMGIINMLTTIITGLLVDVVGRRIMLLSGSAIAGFSLFLIACLFHVEAPSHWQSCSIVILMMIYIIGYCMSVGSLFWLIISEIFPLAIRDQGASLATGIQWFSNFLVSMTFLSMLEYFGAAMTFFIYAMICIAAMIFVYRLLPETKRLSLEAIDPIHL